jgi:hypothetical protein
MGGGQGEDVRGRFRSRRVTERSGRSTPPAAASARQLLTCVRYAMRDGQARSLAVCAVAPAA